MAPYGGSWEEPYLDLMRRALTQPVRPTRNGLTRSIFGARLEFDLEQGLPVITTKFVPYDLILAELLWFIEGGRNPNYALRGEIYGRMSTHRLSEIAGHKVSIWDGDAANFAARNMSMFNGDCGVIYGSQWRNYNGEEVDQLQDLINELQTNPYGRYHLVTAWNPAMQEDMALPACHKGFQCYVRDGAATKDGLPGAYLDLHFEMRSADLFLGLPFNIASYATLTHMLAQVCGYVPGKLSMTLGDCHIYVTEGASHEAQVRAQLLRKPYARPKLWIDPNVTDIDGFTMKSFQLIDYEHHPKLSGVLSTKNL